MSSSTSSIVAVLLLALVAGTNVSILWRRVAMFDCKAIDNDDVSAHRRKFARLREDLPAGSTVGFRFATPALGPEARGVIDVFAVALHQRLTTGTNEPLPGIDPISVRQVAEGFVARFSAEQNADLATVRANLLEWWTGLADQMQLPAMRYALAPHAVTKASSAQWVVGDFVAGFDYADLAAREHLVLVKDYGGGAVLFQAGQ